MKIAHLADLHLGFRAYHRVTPRGINVREADVADAFRRAVARTVELRPELVLIAGDVFHTVRPSNTSIAEAFRQLSLLTEGLPGVPVVMIAGNHDSPRSSDTGNILTLFREIPGVVVVTDEARHVPLPGIDTSVLCLPHNALTVEGGEPVPMEPDPTARHNVLMLHGTVGGSVAEQKLRYVTEYGGAVVEDTAIGPERWDYVALGHYHIATELAPNMWYAGGVERTSTNLWMEADGPKGFVVYDTVRHRADFHPLETRPVVDLERLSARGLSAAETDERIREAVESIPGGIGGKIVRLVVTDIPRHLVRELNHRRIRDWKAEALHFHLDARPPEVRRIVASGAPIRRQTLQEQVESFLAKHWELTSGTLDRKRLVELGSQYVQRAEEG
ncbi:MAG TPA: exonuclease SbcCD subunit D [Longimicrobiaceae bacterium]|nr:exonuclease SbcCD subunit D [Longimicrobiaceae bacterium]